MREIAYCVGYFLFFIISSASAQSQKRVKHICLRVRYNPALRSSNTTSYNAFTKNITRKRFENTSLLGLRLDCKSVLDIFRTASNTGQKRKRFLLRLRSLTARPLFLLLRELNRFPSRGFGCAFIRLKLKQLIGSLTRFFLRRAGGRDKSVTATNGCRGEFSKWIRFSHVISRLQRANEAQWRI